MGLSSLGAHEPSSDKPSSSRTPPLVGCCAQVWARDSPSLRGVIFRLCLRGLDMRISVYDAQANLFREVITRWTNESWGSVHLIACLSGKLSRTIGGFIGFMVCSTTSDTRCELRATSLSAARIQHATVDLTAGQSCKLGPALQQFE